MKDTAEILAFKGKEIKTVRDLSGAQLALFHDMTSGAVTPAESRAVQEELSARLSEFEASLKAAEPPEVPSNHWLSSALASGDLAGNKDPTSSASLNLSAGVGGHFMRYAKISKLDDLMKKLSDDQLVDLAEKTVKEGDELQHTPSLLTLERLVEVYGKGKACIDELGRRGKIHLIEKYL